MKCASTGIRAVSRLFPRSARNRAGFTLIEALVALALLLAFAATLVPYLFHARRIMAGIDGRIAAQVLLRSLLEAPLDRSTLLDTSREGETDGLHWRITAEPMPISMPIPPRPQITPEAGQKESAAERPKWSTFRVIASVSWGPGMFVSAETVRLGKSK
jgi:prepilin-type N-terminal cleavage/methylation domain-containing protein